MHPKHVKTAKPIAVYEGEGQINKKQAIMITKITTCAKRHWSLVEVEAVEVYQKTLLKIWI